MIAFGGIVVEFVLLVFTRPVFLFLFGAASLKNWSILILNAVRYASGQDLEATVSVMDNYVVRLKLSKTTLK